MGAKRGGEDALDSQTRARQRPCRGEAPPDGRSGFKVSKLRSPLHRVQHCGNLTFVHDVPSTRHARD
ncbi:conserved hypothetical protein [Thiomonas arsenitoxydans]|nr:conserved hypothetical protein [Thiomonas arsenitoxydans]